MLQQMLAQQPGLAPADLERFFGRFRGVLELELRKLVERLLEPPTARLDRDWRGRWHSLSRESLYTELDKARRTDSAEWLLGRLKVHRPDLSTTADGWAQANQIPLPPFLPIPQPIPGTRSDSNGTAELVVYDLTQAEISKIEDIIPAATGFPQYASLAYLDDVQSPGVLLDIAAAYFRQPGISQQVVSDEPDPIRLDQLRAAITAQDPTLTARIVTERANAALFARRQLLAAAGAAAPPVVPGLERASRSPVPRDYAPTPQDILTALQDAQDLRSAAERTEANIRAVRVMERPSEDYSQNWRELMRYSGWGGLSIEQNRALLPAAYVPDDAALIHEYYTPTKVSLAIADVIRPWVPALPRQADGFVMALEPAAGIGRLLNAASTPGFEQLSWTAVEYSEVSAALLQAIRPDLNIVASPFEAFVQDNEAMVAGKLGLILSNPPYGGRGGTVTLDRNRNYRDSKAYVYFLRRGLDLLAEGGVGVYVIPYGFMTGTSGAFANLRESVLKRHHLRAAFRMPSNLFPGAEIVTDVVVFEARGGDLPSVLPEDIYIVEGKYFTRHPRHILGEEIGVSGDDDDASAKPRWGYEVRGEFIGFPAFEPRLRCVSCAVTPLAAPPPPRVAKARRAFEELPVAIQAASVLGDRIKRYLSLIASGEHADMGLAAALQPELLEAVEAWVRNVGGQPRNPWQDASVMLASKTQPSIVSFLSAFEQDGSVVSQLARKPAWAPRFEGSRDDLLAQAAWVYAVKRELTVESLVEFRQALGIMAVEPIEPQLVTGGWCFDDGKWLPEGDYYSGALWDRYFRAKALSEAGDTIAAAQSAKLAELIRPSRIEDIDPEPRMPWVPLPVLSKWVAAFLGRKPFKLVWRDGMLQPADFPYAQVPKESSSLQTMLGYINHDLAYFTPKYTKGVDPLTGLEETAEQALDRARLQYHFKAKQHFKDFAQSGPDISTELEAAYNRLFTGFIMPTYSADPIQIARWTGRIVLKPHQAAGARRLIANNGGLLGFDVGVGKTYTGIATIAKLRQEGRARRAIIVVPNTIVWKWVKDFRTALPDYRIVVIGSNRYVGRSGAYASRVDSPEERSLKWRQFQAGEFDAALVTFSAFPRTQIRPQTLRDWVYETPVILRKLSLDSRELANKIEGGEDKIRKPRISDKAIEKVVGPERMKTLKRSERQEIIEKLSEEKIKGQLAELQRLQSVVEGLSNLSERERAVFGQALDKWLAQRQESYLDPDPGIFFEDLGCDALMVDEAQNFKNLWPVAAREGGIPKYLGAISEGSDRAYALAVRSYLVRQRNGGSGVFLLSATPAKNSPLEYFTLLGYVDSGAWARLGISDPEIFIDRYLRLEMRNIVGADMAMKLRSVVAGFKNLDEFRNAIFRYCEFRTAEEVGLVLPKRKVEQITVPMDERQEAKYAAYAAQYAAALKRSKDDPKAKMKALGLLMRMALTAIHPELDEGPGGGGGGNSSQEDDDDDDDGGRTGWSWRNASQVTDPNCPKLEYVVNAIMKRPDCGHLVFCDNVAVHRWIVLLLTAAGFPAGRIAVFNADQAKDPAKRQSLAERFNGTPAIAGEDGTPEQEAIPPEFDVVIANATAYEGIDLHIRTCEVYHIDLPWEPATLQQRNGRAVRQGNTQSVIGITYLLSDRSLDAVRFSMIMGKLNWMKDVLASAERETNNPAAQSELSGEEMVLFLARDPEEAKAAIQAQKELLEQEQFKRVRTQAWTTLRGLVTRAALLGRSGDAAEKQGIESEITTLVTRLNQIPAVVWPWHFLIPVIQSGKQILWHNSESEGWALLEEGFVSVESSHRGFATGKILAGNHIGIRRFGQAAFKRQSREEIEEQFPRLITASGVAQGAQAWDAANDEELFTQALNRSFELPTWSWSDIDPGPASDAWRTYLIEKRWPQIIEAVKALGSRLEFLIPVLSDGVLKLVEPKDLSGNEALPFAAENWRSFLTAASESGIRYSDLNETALAWWGRPVPRGLLSQKAAELQEISVKSAEGTVQIKPLSMNGSLALIVSPDQGHDHPDGVRYSVIHIPSGRGVGRGFRTEQAGEAAIRFANQQEIDWTAAAPDTTKLKKGFSATLTFIRESAEVPTDDAIRQYALQM